MHGRAIRILLCQLLNYPLKSMDMFEHENLCLYLLEQTGSHFTVRKVQRYPPLEKSGGRNCGSLRLRFCRVK
jgi:broad specificity phosphatase PhoE